MNLGSIRFINPHTLETFDKVYYKSCIVNNELQIRVGDSIGYKLSNTKKHVFYAKILSIYEDMSVRTLNAAGSTLSPFKGEIMAYYMFDEIPAPNFPYKAEYNDDLFVPLFSRDSIIKGSLMTIELRNITEVRDIVFSRDERGPKTLFIRSGFDINGNMLDAKKTIEESTNFANKFLNDISAVLTDAYRANKRSPLIKIFKINEWLEPPLLKLTLPDEDSKISEEAELDKSHRSTPRMSHSSTKRAVQDAQEPSPKKRKASSCAGDIKKVTQPSVSHKPPASLPKTTEISAADILIASPTRVSEISEPSIKTVPVAIGSSVDHTRINYTPLVNTETSKKTEVHQANSDVELQILQHRQPELRHIKDFIRDSIETEKSRSLYISGFPGAGKSLVLNQACLEFQESSSIQYIHIKCTEYPKSSDVLVSIGQKLFGKVYPPKKLIRLLEVYYKSPHKSFTLLILDDFDRVCQSEQYIWYNFCEWFNFEGSKIILIAVSNILDLPERMMCKFVSTYFKFNRLLFNPYNFTELKDFVQVELQCNFDPDALKYLNKKVAYECGGYKRVFKIAARSMEIAQERSHPVATVRDVDEAFSNYSGSRETLIKCLRTLPRIILTSLADFSAKSSDGHVLIRDVFDAVVQQYESNKEEPPTFESILNQANSLHELGLIYNYGTVCENSKVKLNFLRSLLE